MPLLFVLCFGNIIINITTLAQRRPLLDIRLPKDFCAKTLIYDIYVASYRRHYQDLLISLSPRKGGRSQGTHLYVSSTFAATLIGNKPDQYPADVLRLLKIVAEIDDFL